MRPVIASLVVLSFSSALSQPATSPDSLLDHMAGKWVLQGMIAGKATTHDITVDWVLAHQYLEMREVSREKDSAGNAAYEAIVFLAWDKKLNQYGCLWLDITGVWTFSEQGIGRAKPNGNEIPFLFKAADGSYFHTTFVYDINKYSWKWLMDDEEKGKLKPFARVTLTRK
jgi:hypothetical protein